MLHVVIPDRIGVVTGEKFGSCGMALGRVVKLSKPQAIFCQLINVRGFDFTTIATKV